MEYEMQQMMDEIQEYRDLMTDALYSFVHANINAQEIEYWNNHYAGE